MCESPFTPELQRSNVVREDEEERFAHSDSDDEPISRLSRAKNAARKAKRARATVGAQEQMGADDASCVPKLPETIEIPDEEDEIQSLSSSESPVPAAAKQGGKRRPFFSGTLAKGTAAIRERPALGWATTQRVEKSDGKDVKNKKLHPFFAATTAAINNAKERTKRPRVVLEPVDPWTNAKATIHTNAAAPGIPLENCEASVQSRVDDIRVIDSDEETETDPRFPYYNTKFSLPSERPVVSKVVCESSEAWAERYKNDRRIDVINGAKTKELIDWLREWYEKPQRSSEDEESIDSFMYPCPEGEGLERIAIVTGPVGCGKSTLVSNAARQLGLSVLEINASVCRTGKKIKEVIGDALNTHRIAHTNSLFSNSSNKGEEKNSSAKTLVCFEEVDQLYDDEKGFWSMIQKLALAEDCKRPIVCTANDFTEQMKQLFIAPVSPIEVDFERLVVGSKIEPLQNPIAFKHISFASRSERQATAVLNRVSTSEAVETLFDMTDCLAILCGNDMRRAINMLHFWGLRGLGGDKQASSPKKRDRQMREAQDRVGADFIQACIPEHMGPVIFRAGSSNYAKRLSRSKSSTSKAGTVDDSSALDAWTESLEMISCSDMMRGVMEEEVRERNDCEGREVDSLCMHSDLDSLYSVSREMDNQGFRFSRAYLSFGRGGQHLGEIARQSFDHTETGTELMEGELPIPRRPVVIEYLPILKSMAFADERNMNKDSKQKERPRRRTRSRTKQSGFCGLDLDPLTVSALKKSIVQREEFK